MKLDKRISVRILPILQDNYVPILRCVETSDVAVIDPGVADVILNDLQQSGERLTHIFITHHHNDHIGGVAELVAATGAKTIGYAGDKYRLPELDIMVEDGDDLGWNGEKIEVMHLSGHTTGHVAYYLPNISSLFCGDVLFSMGCGRLFEGTYEQMFDSLNRIKKLPEDTLIYCAHEYTLINGEFALSVDSANEYLPARMQKIRKLREQGKPTVPFLLQDELLTNPFLRAENVADFTGLRQARNKW